MAGSSKVTELHGSVHKNYCVGCKKSYILEEIMKFSPHVPVCGVCGAMVRPDVVLYGEALNEENFKAAYRAVKACDLLIVGGTSLRVYPAAGILDYYAGDDIVIINNEETPYDDYACLIIREPIGKVFANVLKEAENNNL
jgi:NAD-dependent deacetylase